MVGRRCCAANPMIRSRRTSKYELVVTSSAATRAPVREANADSSSASSLALATIMRWSIVRAASSISRNWRGAVGNLGLSRTPTSGTPGTRSRNSPRRFGSISVVSKVTPVALPPGWLTLWTKPALTGSPPNPNTIGMVAVARLAASAAGGRQHAHSAAHEIGRHCRQKIVLAARPAELDRNVLALDEAALPQAATERLYQVLGILRRARAHEPDHRHRRLLRARRERPHRCAAEHRDERAPFHC